MAVKGFGFGSRVSRWDVTLTNAKQEELPLNPDDLTRLESLRTEAGKFLSQGEDLRSQLRANTTRLREIVREGDAIRRRMGAILQGTFGFTNDKLIKFGFKPKVVNRRRKTVDKPTIESGEGAQAGGRKSA